MKQMWSKEEIDKEVKNTSKDISTLVDDSGKPRFVEGDGVGLSQEGVTISYCKWSLSGTHLMLVCAGTIADATTIAANAKLAEFNVPLYIMDKVVPIFSTLVNRQTFAFYADNYSTQTQVINLIKSTNINFQTGGSLTLTADRNFRIQYDLLIDVE